MTEPSWADRRIVRSMPSAGLRFPGARLREEMTAADGMPGHIVRAFLPQCQGPPAVWYQESTSPSAFQRARSGRRPVGHLAAVAVAGDHSQGGPEGWRARRVDSQPALRHDVIARE